MPSRKTTKAAETNAAALPSIPKEFIDQFVIGAMSAEAVNAASLAGIQEGAHRAGARCGVLTPPGLPGRHGQARGR